MEPGDCWLFAGDAATATVKLAVPIVPQAFTLEHLPRANLDRCLLGRLEAGGDGEMWQYGGWGWA